MTTLLSHYAILYSILPQHSYYYKSMAGTGSLMEGNITNTSNDSQGCHLMSNKEFITATALTRATDSFTCLACIIAILLIIFLKDYKRFLIRLLLYLNLSVFFFMFAEILQTVPVKNEDGILVIQNKDFCTAAGFLGMFSGLLFILTKFSLALYLILLSTSKNKQNLHSRAHEIRGVIIAFIIASVMATIPLIPFDGDTAYGLIKIHCWIEQNAPDCGDSTPGTVERILLWYLPLFATVVFTIVALVSAVRALRKKPARNLIPTEQNKLLEAHKEARTLTVYVIIFIVVYVVNTVLRFPTYILPELLHDNYPLAMAALITQPLLLLCIPAAYIFHPGTLKKLRCSEVKQTINKWRGIHDDEVYTCYPVPRESEFSEYSDLVIVGSHRHQRDSGYRTMLEQPIAEEAEA